jgi:hypothetical protein
MRPVILYRQSLMAPEELAAAEKHFFCTPSRMAICRKDLVIGRYSVLPFYAEQEQDMHHVGAQLINTLRQHNYIADVMEWAADLEEMTPKTWGSLADVPSAEPGPFVLKGQTNSRKNLWRSHMFAENREQAAQVMYRLMDDTMIGEQGIYVRKYIPLRTFMIGENALPITREFRFFTLDGEILAGGYYWQSHTDVLGGVSLDLLDPKSVPRNFLQEAINRVKSHARFIVIDVAETVDGRWIVIELNDGSMSGLSCVDPDELYSNLAKVIRNDKLL